MGRRASTDSRSKRPTVQVQKEPKDRLVAWIDANDRPEQGIIVGKILDWFVSQPEEVQQVVLRRVPGSMKLAYANALRSLADQLDPYTDKVSHPDQGPAAGGSEASHGEQHGKA